MSIITRIRKNEYFKSAIAIVLVIVVVLGFFLVLQFALNIEVPIRVVESGSMCVPYSNRCDGWSHAFSQTLHVGDIIVIQGVNPEEINSDYPNSDIIVYQNPTNPAATPIVHRVVEKYQIGDIWYFQTKGDGNGQNWPAAPSVQEYDSNSLWHTGEGVSEHLVLGKVVMRIPWFGHITLFLRNNPWGLPAIVTIIIALLVIEFIFPIFKDRRKQQQQNIDNEILQENSFSLIKR